MQHLTVLTRTMRRLGLITGMFASASAMAAISYNDINLAYAKSFNAEKVANYTEAAKVLNGVLADYPATYTVNARLGYLSMMSKNYDKAIAHYTAAAKAVPSALDPKLGLMLVYLTQGQYAKVESVGAQVTKIDYYNYYANLRIAIAQRMQKNYAGAEKTCLKMLDLYPADVNFLLEDGMEQYAAGKIQNAGAVLSSVLTLDPQNATALALLKQLAVQK